MRAFFHFLQSLDRRWIYLVLAITLVTSLLLARPIDPIVLPPVQQLFDYVEQTPAGPGDQKIILVGMTFSPSTLGESGNQARALIRHLMLRDKRFAIISVGEFQGAILGKALVEDLAKQYNYQYGEDWISFGFQLNATAFYTQFPRDIPGAIKTDSIFKKPLEEFEIMQGIKTTKANVPLFIDVTASSSVFNWIAMVQGRYGLKIGYACTGVMAAEAYPFLDSGQFVGMLPGLKGASDYEKLVDDLEAREIAEGRRDDHFDAAKMTSITITPARKLMFTQGAAHIVIILFILLGNIGLLVARRVAKKEETHG